MKILVTGVSGMLGLSIIKTLSRKSNYVLYGTCFKNKISIKRCIIKNVDLTDKKSLNEHLKTISPDIIIHCAALTDVDLCEENKKLCFETNLKSTSYLSDYCQKFEKKLIFISTDSVYGSSRFASTESQKLKPMNNYARSKTLAEKVVKKVHNHCIIRTNIFGISPKKQGLFDWFFTKLNEGNKFYGFDDAIFNPIYTGDLSNIILTIIKNNVKGIINV